MAATQQVILLERIDKLGAMGEVVNVKPGYARNFLLPQKKALRATEDNMAYFEAQKKSLEAENDKRRKEAEKEAEKLKDLKVPIIRQASESGQLYGSVTSRDIVEGITNKIDVKIERRMIDLNQNFKMIGLFPVIVALHPEVKVEIMVNIARTGDEAKTQEESGRALIMNDRGELVKEDIEAALEDVLEDTALEAAKEAEAEAEAKEAADAIKQEESKKKQEAAFAAQAAAREAEAKSEIGSGDAKPKATETSNEDA